MTYLTKVAPKGQITLPKDIREEFGLGKDSYLTIDKVGKYILMKKITSDLDEITDIFQEKAKEKGITKKELIKTLREVQRKKWQ